MNGLNSKINEKNMKINKEMVHITSYFYDSNFAIRYDGYSNRFVFL